MEMGFLNMVISSSVFHILLYISQFNACFSLRHTCFAVCSGENLLVHMRLGVQEELSVAQRSSSSVFQVAL